MSIFIERESEQPHEIVSLVLICIVLIMLIVNYTITA